MKKCLQCLIAFLMSFIVPFVESTNGAECLNRSKLNDREAESLLMVTPQFIEAGKEGGGIDIMRSDPSTSYPAPDFFVASIVTRLPTDKSFLGNGIVGYFVVDKGTAEVDTMADFSEVTGVKLRSLQKKLRQKHCITEDDLKDER